MLFIAFPAGHSISCLSLKLRSKVIRKNLHKMNLSFQKYINRDSNMELLRILAMFGILVLHADFFSLDAPTKEELINAPFVSTWRIIIENVTIISVNLFVLLSGWYGIHPKKKRFLGFIFQILFFNILFFCAFTIVSPEKTLTLNGFGSIFMLDTRFWFVKAYLLLYLISPILNSYIEKVSQKQFKFLLIGFFIFQTVYGWLFSSVLWFKYGYSTISFIFIYLLASYLRKYMISGGGKLLLLIYAVFVLLNSAISYACVYYDRDIYIERLIAYNSPLVILASVAVFLYFTKVHLKSGFINMVAISSFAVFLFHCNYFFLEEVYRPWIMEWFAADTFTIFSVKALVFILVIFSLSIILDKIRIKVWKQVSSKI